MNISSFKRDINKAAYRVIQIKEIYDNILNIDKFVDNKQFNIEGLVSMLISNGKQDILNITLIQDILKNITDYYANIRISHNFDIILQNQEFLQILIRLISSENDEKIRYYSFIIIFLLISYNHIILCKLIEYDLYKSFASILSFNTRFDSLGYFFVSRILHDIFSYPDCRVIEPFLQSPLSFLLIELLSDTSNMKSIDNIFDKFKCMQLRQMAPSEMLSSQKKVDFYKENYFEELIISIIEILYKLFGKPDNDMTHQVVKAMNKLMTTSSKKDLTCSVSRCLSTMIITCKYALIQSLNFGLIQSLNMKLDSIEYKFAWSHIIKVNIISLQCILAEINNPNNQQDMELNTNIVRRLLITIRTKRLYNLINYSIRTYEEDEKDDQQKFVSQVLNCFSILFHLNPQMIIEEYNEQFDRTQVLTLEELHHLLTLLDDSVLFSLKKKGVLFILSSINYQDCLHSHLEIIDSIFSEYNEMILSVLETSKNPIKKLALTVLINITDKILTTEFQGEGVISFIKNQELGNLVEEWKYNDDDEIRCLSTNFYNQVIQLFS